MKLNKKQEKAIRTATDALNLVLTSGLCSDEDGSIKESIEELVKMREKSLYQKAKEKARQKYLTNCSKHRKSLPSMPNGMTRMFGNQKN